MKGTNPAHRGGTGRGRVPSVTRFTDIHAELLYVIALELAARNRDPNPENYEPAIVTEARRTLALDLRTLTTIPGAAIPAERLHVLRKYGWLS